MAELKDEYYQGIHITFGYHRDYFLGKKLVWAFPHNVSEFGVSGKNKGEAFEEAKKLIDTNVKIRNYANTLSYKKD